MFVFFFKQKTAYEMRISDWSSDVCSSDLIEGHCAPQPRGLHVAAVFAADVVERMTDLPQRMGLDRFHQRGEHVAALAGGVLQVGEAMAVVYLQLGRASCRARVCQYV